MERSFLMIKPDGVKRAFVGRIIAKLEDAGLKLQALQLIKPSREIIEKQYPKDEEWLRTVGGKSLETYKKYGIDPVKEVGTAEPLRIGEMVREWLMEYIISGTVVAMVVEGNHAVEVVRKLVGSTIPIFAAPGTIRGDYGMDSPDLANAERRAVYNLVHASGSVKEAEYEISVWFGEKRATI